MWPTSSFAAFGCLVWYVVLSLCDQLFSIPDKKQVVFDSSSRSRRRRRRRRRSMIQQAEEDVQAQKQSKAVRVSDMVSFYWPGREWRIRSRRDTRFDRFYQFLQKRSVSLGPPSIIIYRSSIHVPHRIYLGTTNSRRCVPSSWSSSRTTTI